jgi:hypothetical protein
MSSSDVTTNVNIEPNKVTATSTFNRTPYIVIAIVCLVLIFAWVFTLYAMYYTNSGIFGGDTERPPPSDSELVPVNGEIVELTPEEQQQLQLKVQQALNNVSASNQ